MFHTGEDSLFFFFFSSDKTVRSVILCYASESELHLDLIREETK